MRKKYSTLVELRAANAAAQKKWREKNKVLARERVAATYGRARYPEMVAAKRRKVEETHYDTSGEYDQRHGAERPGGWAGVPGRAARDDRGGANTEAEGAFDPERDFGPGDSDAQLREPGWVRRGADKRAQGHLGGIEQRATEQLTENERATYARLEELKARKGPGVVTDLDLL